MTKEKQDGTQEKAPEKARPQNVHQSIEAMTALMAEKGIKKEKGNTTEIKYLFRGIDDIRNAIAPLQEQCALNIIPRMKGRTEKERTTKNGALAIWVILEFEVDFVNTIDGSIYTVAWYGEAVDYSDKSTQKATSQAYKTVCINVFNIPTEGEQDTDEEKKEFIGKRVGVFESEEMRRMWVANCKDSFERADSLVKLKEIEGFNHEKLIIMGASDDVADKDASNDIRKLYKIKLDELTPKGGKL